MSPCFTRSDACPCCVARQRDAIGERRAARDGGGTLGAASEGAEVERPCIAKAIESASRFERASSRR